MILFTYCNDYVFRCVFLDNLNNLKIKKMFYVSYLSNYTHYIFEHINNKCFFYCF